jgi:hypothetical protein
MFEISYFFGQSFREFLENFMGYSNQKTEKKYLKRSGVISILIKCLKSQKNRNISGNIEFHGLKLG